MSFSFQMNPNTVVAGFGKKTEEEEEEISANEINVVLWSTEAMRGHREQWGNGNRIVMKNVTQCGSLKTLIMENDLESAETGAEAIVQRVWRKRSEVAKKITSYVQEMPSEVSLTEKERESFYSATNRNLDTLMREDSLWKQLHSELHEKLLSVLQPVLNDRQKARVAELALVSNVLQKLQRKELTDAKKWKIHKFCPNNNILRFRVESKIPGLGEAEECVPEKYVFVNPFMRSS